MDTSKYRATLNTVPEMVRRVVDSKYTDQEAYEWLRSHTHYFWTYAAGLSFKAANLQREQAKITNGDPEWYLGKAQTLDREGEKYRDEYASGGMHVPPALDLWAFYPGDLYPSDLGK